MMYLSLNWIPPPLICNPRANITDFSDCRSTMSRVPRIEVQKLSKSESRTHWRMAILRWCKSPLLLLFVFFAFYYRWTVQPNLTVPVQEHGAYNMLADAFLAGQTSLLTRP